MRYTTRICGAVLTTAVAILPLRAGAAELRHQWTFNDGSSDDQVGGADGLLEGGASVVDGRLFLDGSPGSRMLTLPLEEPLAAKSLVAWANPSDLTQRGGSILTIEDSPQGDVFDAIVAFEAAPRVWLNGSNGFQRTNPQNGGAEETATCPEQVLMAVVYDEDNTITIYRNGEVYVPPEVATTGALQTFDEFAVVQIGARHGTHNDVFRGFVDEARVYDGALTADEVAGLFEEGPEESVPIESCELGPCEGDTAAVELRHQWTFDDGTADDLVGDAHGQLEGGATIADGQLALDGTPGSRMLTLPLGEELCTKTLVAWVSPSNLIQRGGSVLTIEDSPQGDVFDAIVAFETQPRVWLNGSNFFERTNTANGGAAETTVCPEEVLVAVVYGPGDDVTIYRNGELYVGAEVATVGTLQPFGEEAVVQIGARHGTHNDVFVGFVNEARVYRGALDADNVADIFDEGPAGTEPPQQPFKRGDVDGNGLLDITDPIRNLTFQFIGLPGGEQPTCLDALDDDGNNQIEITDPITSLQIQFVGGAPVDPGFESCGPDNDNDPILGCEAYPAGSCE
jgi:hypothetical protein